MNGESRDRVVTGYGSLSQDLMDMRDMATAATAPQSSSVGLLQRRPLLSNTFPLPVPKPPYTIRPPALIFFPSEPLLKFRRCSNSTPNPLLTRRLPLSFRPSRNVPSDASSPSVTSSSAFLSGSVVLPVRLFSDNVGSSSCSPMGVFHLHQH
jgi:hypothetical protein